MGGALAEDLVVRKTNPIFDSGESDDSSSRGEDYEVCMHQGGGGGVAWGGAGMCAAMACTRVPRCRVADSCALVTASACAACPACKQGGPFDYTDALLLPTRTGRHICAGLHAIF